MKFKNFINEEGFDTRYADIMVKFTKDCYTETGKYPFEFEKGELHKTQAYKDMKKAADEIKNS